MLVKEVNLPVQEAYRHYLTTVRHACNNTVVKYLRNLGKVLHMAVMEGIIRQSPMEQITLKLDDVEKDFLNTSRVGETYY